MVLLPPLLDTEIAGQVTVFGEGRNAEVDVRGSFQVPQMRQNIYDAAPKGSIGNRPNSPANNQPGRKPLTTKVQLVFDTFERVNLKGKTG